MASSSACPKRAPTCCSHLANQGLRPARGGGEDRPPDGGRDALLAHSGFSVDNSVYLSPGDTSGLERLAQYILRCPFSLARVVRLRDEGSVIYRAEQDHCCRFPGPASADLRGGPCRNFQVFTALDFLAELTQHVPNKGEHLVRYYGWYSHRQRGFAPKSPLARLCTQQAGEGRMVGVRELAAINRLSTARLWTPKNRPLPVRGLVRFPPGPC